MPEGRQARITVIDDAPDFLALVSEILGAAGYAVTTSTGEGILLEDLARTEPDLIMLDLRLRPVADQLTGMEFLRLIRAHRLLRSVPIIVCSADASLLRDRAEMLAHISRCWILPKPFRLEQLEEAVAAALAASGQAERQG